MGVILHARARGGDSKGGDERFDKAPRKLSLLFADRAEHCLEPSTNLHPSDCSSSRSDQVTGLVAEHIRTGVTTSATIAAECGCCAA